MHGHGHHGHHRPPRHHGFGHHHHHHHGMHHHRPPRPRGCCGCFVFVLPVAAILAASIIFLITMFF